MNNIRGMVYEKKDKPNWRDHKVESKTMCWKTYISRRHILLE